MPAPGEGRRHAPHPHRPRRRQASRISPGDRDVVYEAIVDAPGAPKDDGFQIVTEHPVEDLILDPTYLGIERSPDCVAIRLALNDGRTVDQKRAFYRKVADGLHHRLGLRREDVFVSLVEVVKEN